MHILKDPFFLNQNTFETTVEISIQKSISVQQGFARQLRAKTYTRTYNASRNCYMNQANMIQQQTWCSRNSITSWGYVGQTSAKDAKQRNGTSLCNHTWLRAIQWCKLLCWKYDNWFHFLSYLSLIPLVTNIHHVDRWGLNSWCLN